MILASLYFSGRNWLWPAGILLLVAVLFLIWSYQSTASRGWARAVGAGLKLTGLVALAFCLLEPVWTGQRAKPGANLFVILADNSQGLNVKDQGETQTRAQHLGRLLNDPAAAWSPVLEEQFQARRYLFDSRLQPVKDFAELRFDGRATALGAALRRLGERYRGRPLAGVLLFTDGNATDIKEGAFETKDLPPIYPVVLGRGDPSQDIAIQRVTVSQTSFEDAPVTIQAEVSAAGYAGANILAELIESAAPAALAEMDSSSAVTPTNRAFEPNPDRPSSSTHPPGKTALEQTLKATRSHELLSYRFQIRPARPGLSFYWLRVGAVSERDQFQNPALSREATLANNVRALVVDRGRGPYRILYVGGRPNWEFKFLNRALAEDDQLKLVGLIRVARREPKFEFKGRVGESSNPLFRGFDRKTEETEQYDQPVLIRLNTRDELELKGGFPKTEEDLYGYQAVILDDVEASFFTQDQMSLLQRYVSERGGGFLMLGGVDTFREGHYEHTPIANLLPVYLDAPALAEAPKNLRLDFTREGWLQPWARLRAGEADERSRLEAMPGFRVLNAVQSIKPGAIPIATVSNQAKQRFPALVAERFGRGRTAALLIGDMWSWGMREESMQADLGKAWLQMIRWLVADVPLPTSLSVEPQADDSNQTVQLEVRVRDKTFHALDNASVVIDVRKAASGSPSFPAPDNLTNPPPATSGEPPPTAVHLSAEPALSEAGLYRAAYVTREPGAYLAEAIVTDPNANGVEVGRAAAGWTSDPAAEEFQTLKPNRPLLETLARKTGGETITVDELESFAKRLPNRQAPVTETWNLPLWHQAVVFLFALACFLAEWGLRRWKGLA
jgi:uncharacterized membrane protein